MSFPRYPTYKDSGAEWGGEIPKTWTPTRLRFLLQDGYDGLKIGPFGSQLTSDMLEDEGTYKVYGQENIIANDFVRGNRYIGGEKFSELSVYEIKPGDLLITMMGTSGRCDVAPSDMAHGIMDSHLLRMRVTAAVRADFVRLLIDEAAYVGTQIQLAGKGSIMHGLNSSIVKNLLLFAPPIEEQAQILAFLDRETAKIDGLVAEQRRLMELLKEKRQAVISHSVTKGLNSNAPMKPSGIEWLGAVPAHWGVSQSRRMFSVRSEPAVTSDRMLTASQKYGVLFQSDFVEIEGRRVVEVIMGVESLKHVEPDDFIISMRSFQGGIEWCRLRGSTSFHYVMLKPIKGVHPPFFAHLFKSVTYIQALRTTTDLIRDGQELRYSHFVQVHLPVVPMEEQARIAAFLDGETGKIDELVAEAQRAIDLLQERRTALISATVTGQIDVRGLVATEAA